mgnify:CR=1 FL=1
MIRNIDGHVGFYATGEIARPDEIAKTTWTVPEHIPARNIKRYLCKDGPKMCKECQLCEYGKQYLKLQDEKARKNAAFAVV